MTDAAHANWHVAYIALGANLGDRAATMNEAIAALRKSANVVVNRVSPFIETAAVGGGPDAPPYLNAAAALRTTLSPRALLDLLLEIEHSLGRVRRERWESRPIDLDVLLYDDLVLHEAHLVVPHPLMHARRFVLEPLATIAANERHPVLQRTIAELLAACG